MLSRNGGGYHEKLSVLATRREIVYRHEWQIGDPL